MKNSTTALILATMCLIGNLIKDTPQFFIGICIFIAAYLILDKLGESGNKL